MSAIQNCLAVFIGQYPNNVPVIWKDDPKWGKGKYYHFLWKNDADSFIQWLNIRHSDKVDTQSIPLITGGYLVAVTYTDQELFKQEILSLTPKT